MVFEQRQDPSGMRKLDRLKNIVLILNILFFFFFERLVDYCGYPNMRSTITTVEAQSCAMTIFLLIDFLQTWKRVYRSAEPKRDFVLVRGKLFKNFQVKI